VVVLVMGALRGLLISTKKREKNGEHKVQRNLVQDDLKQQTSEALTTETKKQVSRDRVKVQSATDRS
jgi:hypothetical protein